MASRKVTNDSLQYSSEITPLKREHLDQLEKNWRSLEARTECSFFQSWNWMGSWLDLTLSESELYLYQCFATDELIALGVISRNQINRHKLFNVTCLTLNSIKNARLDMNIEYNNLLVQHGHETKAWHYLIEALGGLTTTWDEFSISCVTDTTIQILERAAGKSLSLTIDDSFTPWPADIQELNDNPEAIFNRLSKNRRWQIKRSFKEYFKEGEIEIEAATNLPQALAYFDRLGILHTARWNRVGQGGSFANPNWVKFHRNVIAAAFSRGEIQLLRVHCASRDIGYIYNFLWRKTIYMLQTGFAEEASNILRPGYVSHVLAMQFNAKLGIQRYDFMWGDSEYKSALASAAPPVHNIRLQRPRLKLKAETHLISMYRNLRKMWPRLVPRAPKDQ